MPTTDRSPAFSIVTATYNSGELLERTAGSLVGQSFRDFEWLVIDGGSSDDTVDRIERYGPLVAYAVSEKDRGIADAWNKGLAIARGRYILFLNAGDTYDSDFLERVYANRGDGTAVVCSHARLQTEAGRAVGVFKSQPRKLYRAMHLAHNWCAVPRCYYESLGGFRDMRLAMDFEWFHRFYKTHGAGCFRVIDAPLGTYHLGGTSDVNYASSFRANEAILAYYGTPRPVAKAWRFAYTAKHAVRQFQTKAVER